MLCQCVHDSYECYFVRFFFVLFVWKCGGVTESVKIATLTRSLFRACCFSLSEDRKAIAVLRFSLSAENQLISSHGSHKSRSFIKTSGTTRNISKQKQNRNATPKNTGEKFTRILSLFIQDINYSLFFPLQTITI